ncbi:MAG: nucleotide exchange factor GrpE [Saprospiraceae bacterium]|nr:nucleotide exchange factor GrpE [Candidatus Vicinibacter affinis]MBK6574586.1 nucleotide exchange factor GrpE [Candidatus Vicinibacter affinis]MBK7800738.1 nucleotide exchange factor GrpE [Candidatus Vicinibacter affinis]MBK9961044.1 nucleotide exchange factor GrpE [Candidatus Vicinibacter affinis]HQX44648.1 nucleotide exchange factor GrpE [Saprospiraceae bacterium]
MSSEEHKMSGNEIEIEHIDSPSTPESQPQNTENKTDSQEKLETELAEQKDKYLRLFAEFDNYKKRTTRERIELIKTAAQDFVQIILPVLDDFDRAQKLAEEQKNDLIFPEGMKLMHHKLIGIMKNSGVEAMQSNGLPFDPNIHEAITEIPAPSEEMKGKIVDTVEKGYYMHDKIIRFAKVVVGK